MSFRAVFDGGRTREQIDSVTLNELADEALRLSWVAIDFAPAGEEQSSDWGAAMEMYRTVYDRFVQEFGEQAIKRVYLSAPHSGGRISHRSRQLSSVRHIPGSSNSTRLAVARLLLLYPREAGGCL